MVCSSRLIRPEEFLRRWDHMNSAGILEKPLATCNASPGRLPSEDQATKRAIRDPLNAGRGQLRKGKVEIGSLPDSSTHFIH